MPIVKVGIGSTNPAKLAAVQAAYHQINQEIEIQSIDAPSGVAKQPMSLEETRRGAVNRALYAAEKRTIGIGLEGGVYQFNGQLWVCNWGALVSGTEVYTAAGAQIPLPDEVAKEVLTGRELGPVLEAYFNQQGLRQQAGAMGMFTNQLVNRKQLFEQIVLLVLGQWQYGNQEKRAGQKV